MKQVQYKIMTYISNMKLPPNLSTLFNFSTFQSTKHSLRKTVGKSVTNSGYTYEKVSLILVTLTSRSDSDFVSLKKINLMALIRTLMISTTMFERMKEKFYGFWQTEQFSSHSITSRTDCCNSLILGCFQGYFEKASLKTMPFKRSSGNKGPQLFF